MLNILLIVLGVLLWYYVSDNYKCWATNFDIWKMKRDRKKGKKPQYTEVTDDWFDRIMEKKPWFEELYWSIRRVWIAFWDFPTDLVYEIRHAWQRYRRGWSFRDTWAMDWHLTKILPEMLEHLKKTNHGVPCAVFVKADGEDEHGNPTDEAHEKAKARWNKIMDSMILTFKIARKIEEDHWFYQPSDQYDVKLANKYRKIQKELRAKRPNLYDEHDNHVMTKEECKVYEKGWKLFQTHFFSLWD